MDVQYCTPADMDSSYRISDWVPVYVWEILRPSFLFSEQGSSITTSLSPYPYGCTNEYLLPSHLL